MKKKIIITAAVVAVVVLALVLPVFGGRSAVDLLKENIALVKAESGGIAEFFGDKTYCSDEKEHVSLSSPASGSAHEPVTEMHTEVIASPYNSAEKARTIASVGEIDLSECGENVPDELKSAYTAIPSFVGRDIGSILPVLTAHGITVNTVTRTNTAPAGEVFALRYAGLSDESGYYIIPSVAVTLYVSAPKKAVTAYTGDNIVYLTFDDGPNPERTEEIIDILDTYGIRGAFFTVGTAVDKNPDLVKEVYERGHAIGCHTVSHVYTEIYSSVYALEDEVVGWEKAMADAGITLGDGEKLFRFPGGSVGKYFDDSTKEEMHSMLQSRGYRTFDWNVSANDAVLFLAPDDESSYDYIKKSFADSLETCLKANEGKAGEPIIVLMHESSAETPELLTWIIEYLIGKGLSFGDLGGAEEWMF